MGLGGFGGWLGGYAEGESWGGWGFGCCRMVWTLREQPANCHLIVCPSSERAERRDVVWFLQVKTGRKGQHSCMELVLHGQLVVCCLLRAYERVLWLDVLAPIQLYCFACDCY